MESLNNHEPDQPAPEFAPEFHLDAETFIEQVEANREPLLSYGTSLSGSPIDAENYLSKSVENAWKNRENIRKLKPYLYASVRNANFDNKLRTKETPMDGIGRFLEDVENDQPKPDEIIQYNFFVEDFNAVLGRLTPEQAEAVQARLIDGLSVEESQKTLGIDDPAVLNSRLYRAKQKLQTELDDWR